MNIFILDNNIEKSVQYYCNKHCIKMILEMTQIICTVLNEKGFDTSYRSTHRNHPCVKWASESLHNFLYLWELVFKLNEEYKYRYNKKVNHKSIDALYHIQDHNNNWLDTLQHKIFNKTERTPFVQCMPEQYKCSDPVQAYRNYYIGEKQHIAKWTKRPVPGWFIYKGEK